MSALLACLIVLSARWDADAFEAAAPNIKTISSGDAEIDAALAQSLDLPVLVSNSESFGDGEGGWRAVLAREQTRLTALVRSFGYLDGRVEIIASSSRSDDGPPASLEIRPALGSLFRIGVIQVAGIEGAGLAPLTADIRARLTETVGEPVRADLLSKLSDQIRWQVRSASYPFARIAETSVRKDPVLDLASVVIRFDTGPPASFGPVHFTGDQGLDRQTLQNAVPFAVGDAFDPAKLDALAEAIGKIERVRDVRIDLPEHADEAGRVPVAVRIQAESDPGLLARDWLQGVVVLAAALVALALRQFLIAGGMRGKTPLALAVNGLIGVLVVYGVVLVLLRAIAFIQFG